MTPVSARLIPVQNPNITTAISPTRSTHDHRKHATLGSVAAALTSRVLIARFVLDLSSGTAPTSASHDNLAVLPFEVHSEVTVVAALADFVECVLSNGFLVLAEEVEGEPLLC
jgi:hypothetical protein